MLSSIQPKCPYVLPNHKIASTHFIEFCNLKLGLSPVRVQSDLSKWLNEDHGSGDTTLFSSLSQNSQAHFFIIAKQEFTLSCLNIMAEVFRITSGNECVLYSDFQDGDLIKKGNVVLAGEGSAASILLAERVSLNFASMMSGVATKTKSILDAFKKYDCKGLFLLETRKTTPGLRIYEKYSVRSAGARNHRYGLDSGSMLKENHLRTIGYLETALDELNQRLPILTKIEIEVSNLTEFAAALNHNADVIMLDNFSFDDVRVAVAERNLKKPSVKLELSGNLDEKNISDIASLGVDYISMGALVHKAVWVDMSLQLYKK